MGKRREFALLATLVAATLAVGSASGQPVTPGDPGAHSAAQGAAAIPDFSGVWSHPSLPWFEPPATGPRPVTNLSRKNGVSNYDRLVGDYTNPVLQPWAAEVVKRFGEISAAGITFPNPANQCWPEPVPFIFKHNQMQMIQKPDEITILYVEDHEIRHVRMNVPHPAQVVASWHGDSVGHYEGETLVIDTIGTKTNRPFAMIDLFGTPFTNALHVVERYRLVDYDAAKDGLERDAKENMRFGNINRNDGSKFLQLHLTVSDEGVFTSPWTATVTYGRGNDWPEIVCAENIHEYYYNKNSEVPRADKPDF